MTTVEYPVPVAVVGAGGMGSSHVRVYDGLKDANLVEVVEPDPERAASLREEYEVPVLDDVSELEVARAASITVPNDAHREVAEKCLDAGLDILVEKPLAANPEDAQSIIERAEARDAILQVGHIERFNPAVQTLEKILEDETIIAIEANRLGPFDDHLTGENVVFDLMVHDLDIVTNLIPGEVVDYNVIGSRVRSSKCDHAVVQLHFDNGTIGTLTASHVTNAKIRTLDVVTDGPYIHLDYQQQDVTVQRTGISQTTTLLDTSGYETQTITETPFVGSREPLKNELQHFVECVSTSQKPAVTGEDGYDAVKLSADIVDKAKRTFR